MTIAQQVYRDFAYATKTISVITLAKRAGGRRTSRRSGWGEPIQFDFPDGSSIMSYGRGKVHKLWTNEMPDPRRMA